MKIRRSEVHTKVHSIPELRFEEQQLSSYSGLVIFQKFFQQISLRSRLAKCFADSKRTYGLRTIVLTLIVHFIVGNRRIRDLDYCRNDPLVKRLLGVKQLPDVSTISRTLSAANFAEYRKYKALIGDMVLDRIERERLARITLDFDGSVLSTRGKAEGTAVGFNKKRKGARSYYPLFCTVAQTGQVFDWLDRSGNVHDSNGARPFMTACFQRTRDRVPGVVLESRMDSAFFSDEILSQMITSGLEFSASVPFERFTELKGMIETRKRWHILDETWSYFETEWKPDCWEQPRRFIFIRQRSKVLKKGPIQLDLFEPIDHEYAYKVIVTNKTCNPWSVLQFHNGRGSQEAVFGECKQYAGMDYIPFRRQLPNRIYLASSVMAHNLGREIQMETKSRARGTTAKRSPLWIFDSLGTICRRLLQRAGRLTNRSGKTVLTMNANERIRKELLQYLHPAA